MKSCHLYNTDRFRGYYAKLNKTEKGKYHYDFNHKWNLKNKTSETETDL